MILKIDTTLQFVQANFAVSKGFHSLVINQRKLIKKTYEKCISGFQSSVRISEESELWRGIKVRFYCTLKVF